MKKTLLSLALALAAGGMTVNAQEAVMEAYPIQEPLQKAASRSATEDGFELRFCGDVATWNAVTNASNMTYTCYIYIDPTLATQLAGNKVVDVTFSAVITSLAGGLDGSGFVSETMPDNSKEWDPVVSQPAKIVNGQVGNQAVMQTITFDEPYVIKEGVGFYFGYTVEKCRYGKDYPVAVDGLPGNSFAGYVKINNSLTGSYRSTTDMQAQGTNMVLYANTVGDKHSVTNLFTLGGVSFPKFTKPMINISDGFSLSIPVRNLGDNALTSLTYTTKVNGSEVEEHQVDINIEGDSSETLKLPIPGVAPGNNEVEFNLLTINGIETAMTTATKFYGVDNNYERKFVVEEGTGTWCGWCPRGIVGMESMAEKYPEKFIGIAVHSGNGDPFIVSSYSAFVSKYFSGFPSCIVNRDPYFNIDPSFEEIEAAYETWLSQGTVGEVKMEVYKATEDGKTLKIDTHTTFSEDNSDAKYAIALVIIEDGLVANQSNYYAGGAYGPMDGWGSKPSTVSWTYKDTARGIYSVWGIKSSIPSAIEKDVTYDYSYNYNLGLAKIQDIEQTSVIALLVDTSDYTILNAEKVKAADYGINGISDITVDDDAPVEYYNLQGVRMPAENLPAGVYVVRQGNTATKTVIRK